YFLLHGCKLPAYVLHVGSAHRELGLELRIMRAKTEFHASIRSERLDARKQRVSVRLADTVRMKALKKYSRLHAAFLQEPRDDLLLEQPAQLARHAGGKEEAGLTDIDRESARRAHRSGEG